MNFREKLIYTAFGAFLMLLGVLAANHVTPTSATQHATLFDEIICRRLTVIDQHAEKGEAKITLSADAGAARIKMIGDNNLSGKLDLSAGYRNARVLLIGKNNKSGVRLYADHDGGVVKVDSPTGSTGVRLAADCKPGGVISVFDSDNEEAIDMFSDDEGNGVIMAHSKDGLSASILTADDKGGQVIVNGKKGLGGVVLHLDEKKGGVITTRDANTEVEFPLVEGY